MTIVSRLIACLMLILPTVGLPAIDGLLDETALTEVVKALDPERNPDIRNAFTSPASDVAEEARDSAIVSFLVFLPFLILPNVLLVWVIFKFRDRKDGRKPATFTHNNTLEIVWTAIPFVVICILAFPMTRAVYFADSPGDPQQRQDAMVVQLIGRSFNWEWRYPAYDNISITSYSFINPHSDDIRDLASGEVRGAQAPVAFVKDQYTELMFKSADVNHAWAVPALGVKKDCFQDRWNYAWMTPNKSDFFEGQCYELCGQGHGLMLFGAIVTEDQAMFDRWMVTMVHQFDAFQVVQASVQQRLGLGDEAALDAALAAYLDGGSNPERIFALQYWLKTNDHIAAFRLTGQGDKAAAAAVVEAGDAARLAIQAKLSDPETVARLTSSSDSDV